MTNRRILAALAAIGLSATSAGAATVNFANATCGGGGACANSDPIDPNYGSTAKVAVSYDSDISHSNPLDQLRWWDSEYGDLASVGYGAAGGEPAIILTPLHGAVVTLDSFDLAAFPNYTTPLTLESQVTILEGSTVVFSSGSISVSNVGHMHFAGPYSSSQSITIEWGPDGFDVGVNNVAFNAEGGNTVPEPSTWVMMIAGFAGLCAMGRRAPKWGSASRA
jgi:hypothetical protein